MVCDSLGIIHDLGPADWQLLETIKDILAPFAQAVKKLEGEKYSTLSQVYPILFGLRKKLKKVFPITFILY